MRDGGRAEVLDQRQAFVDAVGEKGRRRVAEAAQPLVHGDESGDVGRELGDRGVRLAEADDGPVRPGRRNHQDRRLAGRLGEPLIGADGRVALQEFARRVAPAGALEQPRDAERQPQARGDRAESAQSQQAEFRTAARIEPDLDLEPVGGQRLSHLLRPLDDGDRVLDRLVPAEIGELHRAAQPVEIGMDHRPARSVIGLHQGEGRARRLELGRTAKRADEATGESRLAGPEIAGEANEVARLEPGGLGRGDGDRRRLVRRLEGPNARLFPYARETDHALLLRRSLGGGRQLRGSRRLAWV